ncbi:TetR/AcrR family transcriptional regulator [Pseudonocardiaceae bacterium YIM PH 21723]|nr:TetR/AcrR family transcriptional regulator [Pseudonocardiaceae bacterium YIM PH 21723]
MTDGLGVPPRGTRPRNRRELIIAAAAELFGSRGYAKVGMSDLAQAVGIGPSALYRHFGGKREVLEQVVAFGLAPMRELVAGLGEADRASAASALAGYAIDHRYIGPLWQREARDLSPEAQASLNTVLREIRHGLTAFVRRIRPELPGRSAELISWSVLAVLLSQSYHHLELPRPGYDRLLAGLIDTALDATPPELEPPAAVVDQVLRPASRREELLAVAMRMFAGRGYAQVGIEDIGQAVGIAGPSVYNHWPTKLDLLITMFRRGAAALAGELATAYRYSPDAATALRDLMDVYVRRSQADPELFTLVFTELEHLPAPERDEMLRAQRDFVNELAHLLRLDQPDLEPVVARLRVHAALSVAAQVAHAGGRRHAPAAVRGVCAALLGLRLG